MENDAWPFANMNADQEAQNPVIMRAYAKPPKEYKYGSDFRNYLAKFQLYCNLNNIPQPQKAPLLLTLLDAHSFNIANNLHLGDLANFNQVAARLTQKFDSPAGELGNQIRLNSRSQLLNESRTDYLDALTQLAQRTNLEAETQHSKIIETMLEMHQMQELKGKF